LRVVQIRLIRLAYTIEFLFALLVVFTVWAQVAGQGHLDLVFWYWKLGLGLGIAYACVRATAAAVEHERTWNAATAKWLAAIVLMGFAAAMVTYYVHLYHETLEEESIEEEESAYTSRFRDRETLWRRGGFVQVKAGESTAHAHFPFAARKLDQEPAVFLGGPISGVDRLARRYPQVPEA
jgi:hypothetical protein